MMAMLAAPLAALALAATAPPEATPPDDDPAANLEQVQQFYDQSCAGREYGAYDDMCDQLLHQVKAARIALDREVRRKAAQPHAPNPAATPAATVAPANALGAPAEAQQPR